MKVRDYCIKLSILLLGFLVVAEGSPDAGYTSFFGQDFAAPLTPPEAALQEDVYSNQVSVGNVTSDSEELSFDGVFGGNINVPSDDLSSEDRVRGQDIISLVTKLLNEDEELSVDIISSIVALLSQDFPFSILISQDFQLGFFRLSRLLSILYKNYSQNLNNMKLEAVVLKLFFYLLDSFVEDPGYVPFWTPYARIQNFSYLCLLISRNNNLVHKIMARSTALLNSKDPQERAHQQKIQEFYNFLKQYFHSQKSAKKS